MLSRHVKPFKKKEELSVFVSKRSRYEKKGRRGRLRTWKCFRKNVEAPTKKNLVVVARLITLTAPNKHIPER